jgi:hypothetical protein
MYIQYIVYVVSYEIQKSPSQGLVAATGVSDMEMDPRPARPTSIPHKLGYIIYCHVDIGAASWSCKGGM